MKVIRKYSLAALLSFLFFGFVLGFTGPGSAFNYYLFDAGVIIKAPADSDTLRYPFRDRYADPLNARSKDNGLYMGDPSNIKVEVEYNPEERQYDINERIGNQFYRNPSYMTFDEFVEHEYRKSTRDYWKQRANEESATQKKGFAPRLYIGGEAFNRIFGGNTIDIKPQGSAELSFGLNFQRYDNPTLPEKQRRNTTFDFKEKIQLNVVGNIGEKLKITTNYNTEASFDFENKLKLEYNGNEDEIIKKIEAGNVNLPLTGTLIQGSQSLFGIKAQLQFGRLTVTSIFSQQKGSTSHISVENGATTTPFDISADQYEANKHFFIGQFFRNQYDAALTSLPFVNSPVNITKIELWRTNTVNVTTDNRNIVALLDLGERNFFNKNVPTLINTNPPFNFGYPSDSTNSLYYQLIQNYGQIREFDKAASVLSSIPGFEGSRDYEVLLNARKLDPNKDFTFNAKLGYVSLNQPLNPNDVLAVAFEYTVGNKVFKVGNLTTDNIQSPNTLIIKLLKGKITNTNLPTWDLMMKNIYSLGGFQIEKEDFKLDVLYYADSIGTRLNFIPTSQANTNIYQVPLNRLLGLDRLNTNNDPRPDGEYDFIEGITINISNGRIIFPELEPFGQYLRGRSIDSITANNYSFDILYDSTRALVLQQPEKNKFSIKGSFKSKSSSEISLNAFNVLEGSVKVTAGGIPLIENVDYTVDYNLGKVKIINQSILQSNTKIDISVENNSLFSIQSKTMMGARFDYVVNKDFTLGGTVIRLNERPITRKVNIGDEPISNTIWGVDGTYRTDSRFITKLVDKLPFISTKDVSNVTFSGEFANLIPGNNKAIGKKGVAYIDDFEGSQSTTDLKNVGSWMISSVPSGNFPEGNNDKSIAYGFNRAKISWYTIDPLFYRGNSQTPSNIDNEAISSNLVRQIREKEIFPNKEAQNGQTVVLPIFDVSYFPAERGPYNYDSYPSAFSAGVGANGSLNDPESRWGGIMRRVESPDFEASNTEFIQFWLMDPATNGTNFTGGDLYFNLGNVSEDILKDNRKQFESGLPKTANGTDGVQVDTTQWGVVPRAPSVNYAFDNNPDSRKYQDVGFDGLSNAMEQTFYNNFLDTLIPLITTTAYGVVAGDPSSDDFRYYNVPGDNTRTILERYKEYSNSENNSPVDNQSGTSQVGSNQPDVEDVNRDSNTETSEQYYEYKVNLRPGALNVGSNYVVDKITREEPLPNGQTAIVTWYQFKVPVREPDNVVGGIEGFNSIGFIRMYLNGFAQPTVLRFAKLEFLKGEWRKYAYDLASYETIGGDPDDVGFDVSAVSIEENGNRVPINYVLPPGIDQELNIGSTTTQRLNEQALSFKIVGLQDGNAKGAFKTLNFDLRAYKRLKMYAHAEAVEASDALKNGDVRMFIRLGNDITENYYEYEIPLETTNWGETDPYKVWPESNWLDLELDKLVQLKLDRNKAIEVPGSAVRVTSTYTLSDGKNFLSIRGNPTLSSVRTILIGIRNPRQDAFNPNGDDGQSKSVEVWINELRLTDFEKKGGWAANGRVTAKLANIGNVALAGTHKSIGFGNIDQKVSERSNNAETSWNVSSTLFLGKFLPEKSGIDLPMYVNYGTIIKNPKYDPLNEDVLFKESLANEDTKTDKNEIKKRSQDYTRTKSINFTNVKKNKVGGGKSQIYDIENFNFTYGYDEMYHRDINIEYDFTKTWRGAVGYNFSTNPKSIAPFAKMTGMKSKYMKPIKDFNINFVPTSFNFRTDIIRTYGEKLYRNNTGYSEIRRDTFFNKNFEMRRLYDMKYDITKALKFDINANNHSLVDEPAGRLDTRQEKDSLKNNFWRGGRNKSYQHAGNLSYQVPLNKFPLLDWVSVNAKYGFNYSWTAGQFVLDSTNNRYGIDERTGNVIQNSNTKQLSGNFTMTQLYNKIPILKKINAPKPKAPPKPPKPKITKAEAKAAADSVKAGLKPVVKKKAEIPDAVRFVGRMIMGVKTVGLTYSETNGTVMPGYRNYSQLFGQDLDKKSPGFGFAFGSQKDLRNNALREAWITPDTSFNQLYTTTYNQAITGRATIEPIDGFKIEITANRNLTQSTSEFFRYNGSVFESQNPTETGSFSISFLSLRSAFIKDDDVNYSNSVFEEFVNNRQIISRRLSALNPYSQGLALPDSFGTIYNDGYGGTQQEVLTAAFLAAYSGKSAESVSMDPFIKIPKPNWRITYDGLSKIPMFKKLFNNISITHGYRSTFNINGYGRNLFYTEAQGASTSRDFSGNFIARKEIQQISITEQFSPLLGVDVTWKNNIQTRVEFKKDRSLSMSYVGTQLTEIKGDEVTMGFGYRIPKFNLPMKLFGRKRKLGSLGSNSLNLTADFSLRRNITIVRKMLEGINQPTAGLNVFSFKASADYAVSERLSVRLFFETTSNTPVVSTSYPTTNTTAGIAIRFSLAQ